MAEIAENETTAAGTPNAPIHGDEETTPEPEQPQDEEITFHNCPSASSCTLEDVAAWLHTFNNHNARSRAGFHFIKKVITQRDRKEVHSTNPGFMNMPQISKSNDEHTAFEKILKQARSNEDENALHSTISLPRELKTVEMQKLLLSITQKDKIRVNNLETLKNYQYFLRTTLHELGFEGIADIITTTGDFSVTKDAYQETYKTYLLPDDQGEPHEHKARANQVRKQENRLLFHTLRTKFQWHSTLKQKFDALITLREEELPATMLGLVALDFVRTTFNNITLDAIIQATMKIMVHCTTIGKHSTFESWHLSYEKEIFEYRNTFGTPKWEVIRLCNAYMSMKGLGRYNKILDLHRMTQPSTMAEILDNAESIRTSLEQSAVKWDLTVVTESQTRHFKKKEDRPQRPSSYNLVTEMLGIELPSGTSTEKPLTYATTTTCGYCGHNHMRSECKLIQSDKILKENAGTIIPHIVKLAESLDKSLFEIRKKNTDFNSKEMKHLGVELQRFQNRDINSLHVAGRKIKDMYEKKFTGKPTYERQDSKKIPDRTHRPQSNDKNARPQERSKQPSRDRERPTSNPPKSTHVTKKPNTKIKQPKQLTFSVDEKIDTNFLHEDESDEDDAGAYAFHINIKEPQEVPDNWESLAEPDENCYDSTKTTKDDFRQTSTLEKLSENFSLITAKCDFCGQYHTSAKCWMEIEQNKLDKDLSTSIIDKLTYNKRSASLYENPSGSGVGGVYDLDPSSHEYLKLISARTIKEEYILTNPVSENCLYTAVLQALWLSEDDHHKSVSKIYNMMLEPKHFQQKIMVLRADNGKNLMQLRHNRSNELINLLSQNVDDHAFAHYCTWVRANPNPSCMLEVASLTDLLDMPIEILRETNEGDLASYLSLMPNGTMEPPFRKPARHGIRLLLKDEHYNVVLSQDSALAPEANQMKDCPLLSTSMHWVATRAVTKPTPTSLLPTALQIGHNADIEVMTQKCLETEGTPIKARAPTKTQGQPKDLIHKDRPSGPVTHWHKGIYGCLNHQHFLQNNEQLFDPNKASEKRNLFTQPDQDDINKVPELVESSSSQDEADKELSENEAGADPDVIKVDLDIDIYTKTKQAAGAPKCALPTCTTVTTFSDKNTPTYHEFCKLKHAILGGKYKNPKSLYDWDGIKCTPKQNQEGAKTNSKIKTFDYMYGATTMQEPPTLMYLPATPQTCALPQCQDKIKKLEDPERLSNVNNEIYNNFCSMTHAIMGGAYETFQPSGTIVCYTWNGKKCLPIPTLQIPGQRSTSDLLASNELLRLQLDKRNRENNKIHQAYTDLRCQALRQENQACESDSKILTAHLNNADYVDHWTVQLSDATPLQAAMIATRLHALMANTNEKALDPLVERVSNLNIRIPKHNIDSSKDNDATCRDHIAGITISTMHKQGHATLVINGDTHSTPLGLAIMHDLISKHSSIQDSVNIESLATQNIAFRISDGISVNPNDVIHTAYNFLESESTTILGICQHNGKKEYILRKSKMIQAGTPTPHSSNVTKRKQKPSPPQKPGLNNLASNGSAFSPMTKKNSPDAKKHHN